ncbi:MAG TPA: hypothetical protein VK081_03990, partial [Planctomycetota bacterium]|nr:hypothetical protein [Planctomycetota bacterium]
KGPLIIEPGGFIAFGHIPVGTAKSKTIKIIPTDDFDLQVESIEFQDLKVPEGHTDKLQVTPSKDGKTLVLEIKVIEGMPKTSLRGKIIVKLNHPAAPEKVFQFNGFVR